MTKLLYRDIVLLQLFKPFIKNKIILIMKRVKVYFLTILLSFVLALVFGWMISSIIVFFIVFLQVEDYGLTTQEKQIAYAGQVISIAIGCMGGVY